MQLIKQKIYNLGSRISGIIVLLPDRTKIFMSALWLWAYITFYIMKIFNYCLGFILTHTPDSFLIYKPYLKSHINNIRPVILDAKNTNKNKITTETITNKIQSIVNMKWDRDINNDGDYDKKICGGLNFNDILTMYPALSDSVVWISYLFEIDKKVSEMSDDELGKQIKNILVNFCDQTLYRTSDLNNKENTIFGEIPF